MTNIEDEKIKYINEIYNELLFRDADQDGIKTYYHYIEKEITNENIQKIKGYIKESDEYKMKNNKIDTIIPLNIFQTWNTKDLPIKMKENMELLKKQNPEFIHYLFDDNDCHNFINEYFEKDVLDTYNSLIPGAYKADLWRYCVLYIHGGIYLDIKYKCTNEFKLIKLTKKEYFVKDRIENCIYNALIITVPKNEIMLKCINQIVKNVNNNYYGINPLYPTGPGLLGNMYYNKQIKNLQLYFIRNDIANKEYIVLDNIFDDIIILESYNEYRKEQKEFQKTEHYHILWESKRIYTNNIIPLNIFQTWNTKDLPIKMKANMELLKQQNPEFKHYLFDDKDCYHFIEENFDKDVLDAYISLIPGAYKADLWRYCVLYIYGGIYLDIKFECVNDFKFISLTKKEYFVRDNYIYNIYNALIITLPKNEIMLKCIQKIIENVNIKYYGDTPLHPTGPALLGSFFKLEEKENLDLFHIGRKRKNFWEKYIFYNNKLILKDYNKYNEEKMNTNKKDYPELWCNKEIYK